MARYLKLLDATVELARGRAVELSVTLDTIPVRSTRLWFPYKHMWNDGKGGLFATEWILQRKNEELQKNGEGGAIRASAEQGF